MTEAVKDVEETKKQESNGGSGKVVGDQETNDPGMGTQTMIKSDEELIEEIISRLEGYQAGPLKCIDTEKALVNALALRNRLTDRKRKRKEQGVLGTENPHKG